jgi:hypothetical protein
MVAILNFKNGAMIIKLNAAVTNLHVQGILISHCWRDKNKENKHFLTKLLIELS